MLDARIRPLIDPPLNQLGRALAVKGVSANGVTLAGMIVGLGAGLAIWRGWLLLGLLLILLNRVLDGLDGAIARATRHSDFGGYLDIVADYVFYIAVPLAFGFAAPANLPGALVLVGAFTLTAVSFLAFAAIAASRGLETQAHGRKSFFYSTGLAEGAETIAAFVLMGLLPQHFPAISMTFAGLCLLTVVQRSLLARATFQPE